MERMRAALLGAVLFLLLAWPPPGHGLWFDEVFTANLVTFRLSPESLLARVAQEDAHPPLFYLLAYAYARATGLWGSAVEGLPPSLEERVRLLNLPLGAATAALVGWVGGGAGALALASSPEFLVRAGEFRMYPLLALFWTLAYVGVLRNRPSLAAWAGLGALYTHYLAPFFLLPLYGALLYREGRRALFALWPLLLFLPWVPALLGQLKGGMAMAAARPSPVLAFEPFYRLTAHESLSLLLLGVILYGAWKRRREEGVFLLVPLLAVLLWWGASQVLNTVSLRYVGAFLPPMALALGLSLKALSRPVGATVLVALGVAYLSLLLSGDVRSRYPDEGFREKALLLSALARNHPSFEVLGDEKGRLISLRYYWRSQNPLRLVAPEDLQSPPFRDGVLVLLQYPGWTTEKQVWMARLLARAREEGRLKLLNREGGVLLYLWEKP